MTSLDVWPFKGAEPPSVTFSNWGLIDEFSAQQVHQTQHFRLSALQHDLQLLVFTFLNWCEHLKLQQTSRQWRTLGQNRSSWPSRLDLARVRVSDRALHSLFGARSPSTKSIQTLSITTADLKQLTFTGMKTIASLNITALELSCSLGWTAADFLDLFPGAARLTSLRLARPATFDQLERICRRCTGLRSITLVEGVDVVDAKQARPLTAITHMGALRTLSIDSWQPDLVALDALDQTQLKDLTLRSVGVWVTGAPRTLPVVSSLRKLCLSNICLMVFDITTGTVEKWSKLRTVSLLECQDTAHLLAALRSLRNLRTLQIVDSRLTKTVAAAVGQMGQLTKLVLAGPVEDDWLPLLANLQSLTWLHVSEFISGFGLAALTHSPLTFLSLACNTSRLGDSVIDLSMFPRLKGLSLRRCRSLSTGDRLLEVLRSTGPTLTFLDLRGLEDCCKTQTSKIESGLQSKHRLRQIVVASTHRLFPDFLQYRVVVRAHSSHYATYLPAPGATFRSTGQFALPESERFV